MKSNDSNESDDLDDDFQDRYSKLRKLRRAVKHVSSLASSSSQPVQIEPVVEPVEVEANALLETTPPPKKAKKLHFNAKPDISQSDVPGCSFNTKYETWRGQVQNKLKSAEIGKRKCEYTKYFKSQEEAEKATIALRDRLNAEYEVRTQQWADEHPLCRGLPRGPDNAAEAEPKKAYWRPNTNNGHKPFKVVRSNHGKEGLVWVAACQDPGCSFMASSTGKGQPKEFCSVHGGHYRCIGPADGVACPLGTHANPAYDNYCVPCFVQKFPTDLRAINANTKIQVKEYKVRDFLADAFPEYRWTFNRRFAEGVLKRPDAKAALSRDRILIVEVDEHSHDTYPCDREREREALFKKHSSRNAIIHLIRFNPDAYDDPVSGKRVPSCFSRSKVDNVWGLDPKQKKQWEARLSKLKEVIDETITHKHEDIRVPDVLMDDERYKYVIPIELFYDNVIEKWPDGNEQKLAALKRNAQLEKVLKGGN